MRRQARDMPRKLPNAPPPGRHGTGWAPAVIARNHRTLITRHWRRPVMMGTIVSAIKERKMLEFEYGGHLRIAEPHVAGTAGAKRRPSLAYLLRL